MNDKLTNELLPCPFCGGEAGTLTEHNTGKWKIWCLRPMEKCGAILVADTKEQVERTWNRRSRLANAQGEVVAFGWYFNTGSRKTSGYIHGAERPDEREHWMPLFARPAPSTLPDSLPDEPTEEMIDAMCKAATDCEWPQDFGKTAIEARQKHARAAYKAMLRAHMGRKL